MRVPGRGVGLARAGDEPAAAATGICPGHCDSTGHESKSSHPNIYRNGRGGLTGAAGQPFFTDEIAANDAGNRFPYQGYVKLS
jgi:hypothetical protein